MESWVVLIGYAVKWDIINLTSRRSFLTVLLMEGVVGSVSPLPLDTNTIKALEGSLWGSHKDCLWFPKEAIRQIL